MFEDGNAEYGDYLSNVVDRHSQSGGETEETNGENVVAVGGDMGDRDSRSPTLKRSSSASDCPPSASSPQAAVPVDSDPTSPLPNIDLHYRPKSGGGSGSPHVWLNALLTRLFWDFLREAKWRRLLVEKIQKKLGKMHLPHFMDELRVTEMDLGR